MIFPELVAVKLLKISRAGYDDCIRGFRPISGSIPALSTSRWPPEKALDTYPPFSHEDVSAESCREYDPWLENYYHRLHQDHLISIAGLFEFDPSCETYPGVSIHNRLSRRSELNHVPSSIILRPYSVSHSEIDDNHFTAHSLMSIIQSTT